MRKLLSLSLVTALAACGGATGGGTGNLKNDSRSAMPTKGAVAVGSPKPSGTVINRGSGIEQNSISRDDAAGTQSPWLLVTASLSQNINGGAGGILDLLTSIISQEPASCTDTSCTWGPGSGALDFNVYQLVVSKNGGQFDYVFSAQAKSKPGSAFIPFLTGSSTPSAQPHHGTGNFTVDFDAAAQLDHPGSDVGKLALTYSNVGALRVDAVFTGTKDSQAPTERNNVVYAYANDATGGGDLKVGVHNTTTNNRFSLHSRWKNDGEGRADVNGSGANSGIPYSVTVSECWAVAPFNVVYFNSSWKSAEISGIAGADAGAETQCAYPTASPSTTPAP